VKVQIMALIAVCPDRNTTARNPPAALFTARFRPGPGPVLFDKACQDNGIRNLLTAPY
jgi:hypothetical protein